MTTEDEELKVLERAHTCYEVGIPGMLCGGVLITIGSIMHDVPMFATGGIIALVSFIAIKLAEHLKAKVLP